MRAQGKTPYTLDPKEIQFSPNVKLLSLPVLMRVELFCFRDTQTGVIPVYDNKTFLCSISSFPAFFLHIPKKLEKEGFNNKKKN